ncbi:MAG: hypothetical protein QN162_14655 [Armatimonadota bacterium]|nr:hypothetical protein [Armatimonadota bacterium]MDR7520740.1 hypothetical protein [Armatimonadota bacterium]MDR7534559.1 hypothetical protein [Armatimonadota bacterium]
MAAPVIDAVTPSSVTLSPGQFVDVVVQAHDPDSREGNVEFPVRDMQGNEAIARIALRIDDPLTFGDARNPDGLSVQVQRISASPTSATYRITAL